MRGNKVGRLRLSHRQLAGSTGTERPRLTGDGSANGLTRPTTYRWELTGRPAGVGYAIREGLVHNGHDGLTQPRPSDRAETLTWWEGLGAVNCLKG